MELGDKHSTELIEAGVDRIADIWFRSNQFQRKATLDAHRLDGVLRFSMRNARHQLFE